MQKQMEQHKADIIENIYDFQTPELDALDKLDFNYILPDNSTNENTDEDVLQDVPEVE